MRILLAQINPTIGDFSGNASKILQSIEKGKRLKADLVLFPELAIVGYPPEDFLLLPQFIEEANHTLEEIVAASKGIAVVIGTVRKNEHSKEKNLYNSAAIIDNGKLLGFQDKILLPTYDVFDERRFFEPGAAQKLWSIAGKKVAVTICEDIWQHSDLLKYTDYVRDPVAEIALLRPEVVLNLSSSPFSVGHCEDRIKAASCAAITLQAPLCLCNQVGGNDSLIFDGYSLYIDKKGDLISLAEGFQVDDLLVDTEQKQQPLKASFDPMENLYKALVLGLRDYFHKSGFKKACLGLSGGIDSALVACLAVEALGFENVLAVMMPSRYSSESSHEDAIQLINALKIQSKEISIEGPHQEFLDLLAPEFAGLKPDTTEENIQARIRGMILMALSNKFGYIVLSTGNKSELALGYSTLYGDMCGGLAVISDLTKQQVYALSHWINREKIIIPKNTIEKAPSAELRPNQKDSDSLPEYSIVDNVLNAYIEEHMKAEDIARKFGYSQKLVEELIQKIHRNEYKRRQSPPGLRISKKAFSVGRRFPIVQKFV